MVLQPKTMMNHSMYQISKQSDDAFVNFWQILHFDKKKKKQEKKQRN